jgi:hypothetical protein
VLDVWLSHRRKAVLFDELGDSQESLAYVLRQSVERLDHATVENFDAP